LEKLPDPHLITRKGTAIALFGYVLLKSAGISLRFARYSYEMFGARASE
jgi:hypothetical protein